MRCSRMSHEIPTVLSVCDAGYPNDAKPQTKPLIRYTIIIVSKSVNTLIAIASCCGLLVALKGRWPHGRRNEQLSHYVFCVLHELFGR